MATKFIYGFHSVLALLGHPEQIKQLYCKDSYREHAPPRVSEIIALATQYQLPFRFVAAKLLDKMVAGANHQGIVAQLQYYRQGHNDLSAILHNTVKPPLLLILDGVQDPHNLGSCLRTADAVGVNAIVIPKDRAVGVTAAVAKVASGAAETIPVIAVNNLVALMQDLQRQGVWLLGLSAEASHSIYTHDLTMPLALVLGSEGNGLRRLTQEHCDVLVKIPMYGSVASLNVGVAAAVCLYEVLRQRTVSA